MHPREATKKSHEAAVKSKIMQIATRNREFGWFCVLQININLISYSRLWEQLNSLRLVFWRMPFFLRED